MGSEGAVMLQTTPDKESAKRLLPAAKMKYVVHRELLWRVCVAFDECICPQTPCLADHAAVEELRILAGGPVMSNKIGHTMDGQGFRGEGWVCPDGHEFELVIVNTTGKRCGDCGLSLAKSG